MSKIIDSFTKKYEPFSNFYHSPITYEGITYPTVEHAFQAAKTLDVKTRERIAKAKTPDEAKYLGRRVRLRDDWEFVKVDIMRALVTLKFRSDNKLMSLLKDTGGALLIEGNYWHDNFWGNCTCGRPSCRKLGKNKLGAILMELREA